MWKGKKDLLSMRDLAKRDIEEILGCASMLEPYSGKGNSLEMCKGEILINAFFEPSTRTAMSFETAIHALGGNAQRFFSHGSSIEKGESVEDTIRTLENYCDILAIRNMEPHSVEKLANLVKVPVINAGDGINEHPTQALLDMYTIMKIIGRLDGLNVAIIGDLLHNRPAHSLSIGLGKFGDNKIFGISPRTLGMQEEYQSSGYEETDIGMKNLDETLWKIKPDVVYATRTRKEYAPGVECDYVVNKKTMAGLPEKCIVLHPLPRTSELNIEIDNDARVVPFKQERYGVQTRMAVLALLLGHAEKISAL